MSMETLRAIHVAVNTPEGGPIFLVVLIIFIVLITAVGMKFGKN